MKVKYLFVIFFLSNGLLIKAQEKIIDYVIPKVNSVRMFYSTNAKSITEDITTINQQFFGVSKYVYITIYKDNASVIYKMSIGSETQEDRAFFIDFNTGKGELMGFSKYKKESGYSENTIKENYQELNSEIIYQLPAEVYQTKEWTYKDPLTNSVVSASAYYKNLLFNGKDERVLVTEHKIGTKVKTEYFIKNYGLIAYQLDKLEGFYTADFRNLKLFDETFFTNKNEDEIRKEGWKFIKGIRAQANKNDDLEELSMQKVILKSRDSLYGLYENMMRRYPANEKLHRYIVSIAELKISNNYYYSKSEDTDFEKYKLAAAAVSQYLFLRPTPTFIQKTDIGTKVSNYEESFYSEFFTQVFLFLSSIGEVDELSKSYILHLKEDKILLVENNQSLQDVTNKYLLNSYVSDYYIKKDNIPKAYESCVLSMENYKGISDENKNLNIETMKNVFKFLTTNKPTNEFVLNKAINACINLNDYDNAVKIANNGYGYTIGNSLQFGLLYANVAYQNNIDKPNLRNAMNILKNKVDSMSSIEVKDYIKYCNLLQPEFDCKKAEERIKKAEKEEKEKIVKDAKMKQKKEIKSSGNSAFSLAISTNPINLTWKSLPIAIDIKIKNVLLQARVNDFHGRASKVLWGNAFSDVKKTFSDIVGRDYSLSILGNIGDKYKSPNWMGIHILYGNYTTAKENVKLYDAPTRIIIPSRVSPEITKYEAMLKIDFPLTKKRNIVYVNYFYDFGLGLRTIKYNAVNTLTNKSFSEADMKDKKKYEFGDDDVNAGYDQTRWNKYYFAFRVGFRIGFWLF